LGARKERSDGKEGVHGDFLHKYSQKKRGEGRREEVKEGTEEDKKYVYPMTPVGGAVPMPGT